MKRDELPRTVEDLAAEVVILRADVETLLCLCAAMAGETGVFRLDGKPPLDWFAANRRAVLGERLQALKRLDPDLAEHVRQRAESVQY